MRLRKWLLLLAALCTSPLGAAGQKVGYIDCSTGDKHHPTPIFEHPCTPELVGHLSCGERVEVVEREGPWLKITVDGAERYVGVASVSQKKDRFVALDLPSPSDQHALDCSAFRPKTGKSRARPIYQKDPEYTEEARRAGISGTVMLALTIDINGVAHDIRVLQSLGHGLDEKAVEAVQQWKWEPALEDGKPIESKIAIGVEFRRDKP
jgi:TonB family protein